LVFSALTVLSIAVDPCGHSNTSVMLVPVRVVTTF